MWRWSEHVTVDSRMVPTEPCLLRFLPVCDPFWLNAGRGYWVAPEWIQYSSSDGIRDQRPGFGAGPLLLLFLKGLWGKWLPCCEAAKCPPRVNLEVGPPSAVLLPDWRDCTPAGTLMIAAGMTLSQNHQLGQSQIQHLTETVRLLSSTVCCFKPLNMGSFVTQLITNSKHILKSYFRLHTSSGLLPRITDQPKLL